MLYIINHLSSILLQKMPISGKNVELIISAHNGMARPSDPRGRQNEIFFEKIII